MEKFARYYVKIDKSLGSIMADPSINEGRGLTSLARLIYFSLGQARMNPNSRVSLASYQSLCEISGISSHQTIRKCLKELETNGFLISNTSKGLSTSYILLKGIFFGREELEASSPSVEPTSTPRVEVSRTYKQALALKIFSSKRSKNLQKLQQGPSDLCNTKLNHHQSKDVVVFNKIKSDKNQEQFSSMVKPVCRLQDQDEMPFSIRKLVYEDPNPKNHLKKIPVSQMQNLLDRYGIDRVEEKIILLSFEYKLSVKPKGVDNPIGLLCSALKENYSPSEKHQKYINHKLLELRGQNQIEIEDQKQFKESLHSDQCHIQGEYILKDDVKTKENEPAVQPMIPQIEPILDIRVEANKSLEERLDCEWNALTKRYSPDQLDELEIQAKEKFRSKAWSQDRKKLIVVYFKSFVDKKEGSLEETDWGVQVKY